MESASSRSDSAGKCLRICSGDGLTWSTSMNWGRPGSWLLSVPGPMGISASRPLPRPRPRWRVIGIPRGAAWPRVRSSLVHDLLCQLPEGLGPPARGIVDGDRLTMAGRLGDADVARDQGLVQLVRIGPAHLVEDVPGQGGAGVELRDEDPGQVE